jgi:hypothetical protein
MNIPIVIKQLILDYYHGLIHAERLDRVHAQMLIQSYIIFRPRALTSIYYWLLLD